MSLAYILDTETTGFEAPEVIQLALYGPLNNPLTSYAPTKVQKFRPSKPISVGAMAVHHILDTDLTCEPPWQGYTLPTDCAYLIGHSVDYDWQGIGSPNVKRICTLALARQLWPDNDGHSLVACMYRIYPHAMARSMVKGAHDAEADVHLCERLLGHLYDALGKPETWEQLWRLSEEARIPKLFTFGKHQGALIADIRRDDPGYVHWLLSGKCDTVNEDPYLRMALTR